MARPIRTLAENYAVRDGLYTPAAYLERPDYRFVHDDKRHHHDELAASIPRDKPPFFRYRHWEIQDVYDSDYYKRMIRAAADYGMNGIQWSGDHIYWVNDSLYRYNAYAHTGHLCELCHDHGLKAYFWTHEINDFFHEFVKDGKYGYSGQLVDGRMDLSAKSGYWKVLEEKYDVFFRRMPGVDGLVLTLNECHVPVFREGLIDSDLPAEERVARIARIVADVCARHGKHLILRTFCYTPDESATIKAGVERIGRPVTLMFKCQPHDWHIYSPHNPLIAAFAGEDFIVECEMALEFMGDGRVPAPQVDYLHGRIAHAAEHRAAGLAGRVCRFRHHAEGTMNWANTYAFSRLAQDPATPADVVWNDYARHDWGRACAPVVVDLGRRLHEIAKEVFYLAREQRGVCNFNTFPSVKNWVFWSPRLWAKDDPETQRLGRLFDDPTPEFIAEIQAGKDKALKDLVALREELHGHERILERRDYLYLQKVLDRYLHVAEAFMHQHMVELMVRHDAPRPAAGRRYEAEVARRLARLRELIETERQHLLDAGAEGCQENDVLLEVFCRHAEAYLRGTAKDFR